MFMRAKRNIQSELQSSVAKSIIRVAKRYNITEVSEGWKKNREAGFTDWNLTGLSTLLCELLSFAEQAVEDSTEVTEQPLGVLQQLQGLGVGEVGGAVKQRSAWRPNKHR